MSAQFSRGGQGGPGGGGGPVMMGGGGMIVMMGAPGMGDQGQRQRRQSQVSNVNEVRERIVVVKDSDQFIPKLVKVGPSNFDYAEILEGLNAGDEIQVTTISRAKVAAEQMNERMRSNSGLSGMTGGGARGR
jgi:hypothetical protein